MKSFRSAAFLAILTLLGPALFAADFGVRAGRFNDSDRKFVGAEMLFDAGVLNINPNLEYQTGDDDVTAGTANFDITFDLLHVARVTPYLGAGVGLSYVDNDAGGSDTVAVGNLIGGVSFNLESLQPYAQLKYVRALEDDDGGEADDDFAIVIGLRF